MPSITMDAHYIGEQLAARILPRIIEPANCTRDADGFLNESTCIVPFWYTRTGVIVKWAVFLGLSLLFGLYLIGGYIHAKRRIRKGLRPLAYHRWLVPRTQLALVDPRYAYTAQPAGFSTYRPDYYGMHAMPPPVYDPNAPRPPVYEGMPDGATKTDPSQWRSEPTRRPADQQAGEYEPPAGPPPAAMRPQGTGSSNPFRG